MQTAVNLGLDPDHSCGSPAPADASAGLCLEMPLQAGLWTSHTQSELPTSREAGKQPPLATHMSGSHLYEGWGFG